MLRAISKNGIDFTKGWETFVGYVYDDKIPMQHIDGGKRAYREWQGEAVRGTLTIGYGHTNAAKHPLKLTQGLRITEPQACEILDVDLDDCEAAINRLVKVALTQGQFDALTDITFTMGQGNLAKSSLLQKLNAGDYAGAREAFGLYVYSGGEFMHGLKNRRDGEQQLWDSNGEQQVAPDTEITEQSNNMTISLKVLDISHHNDGPRGGAIDFQAIFDFGVRGIIHKSSQGTGNVDAMYARRRDAALAAGLLWGAYHFADGSDAAAQWEHFMDAAAPDEKTLMALDFEPNGGNTMNLASARTFLRAGEAELGRKLVLYSGNLIKETLGNNDDDYLSEHRLWLAQYGPTPRVPSAWEGAWLWQFSGDGVNNHGIRVPGVNSAIAGQLDMNHFAGTEEQLASDWAS